MIYLVDNYDSFTYNLSQYLRMLGEEVRVVRNDALNLEEIEAAQPRLIVISPGPGGPFDTGRCIDLLDAFHKTIPFLGICLGMQTIAHFFGARVVEALEPVHGKVREVRHFGAGVFRGLPNPLLVTRYHSLVVEERGLPDCLEVTARSPEGEVMALSHRMYPISGVQFHPEAYLTQEGLALLRNALEVACV